MADPTLESIYDDSQRRLTELETPPQEFPMPQAPKVSFLDHASPYLALALRRYGPAVLRGQNQQLANIGSFLAQGYFGGRANAAERMLDDYDRRRAEAVRRNEELRAEHRGEKREARRTASDDARALAQHRYNTVEVPADDPVREFLGGADKTAKRVHRATYGAAVNDMNARSNRTPPATKEPDQGPWMTVSTPNGPKLMRASEAAAQGLVPVPSREQRFPSAPERGELTQDIATISSLNRIRELYDDAFVGPVRNKTAGFREKTTGLGDREASFRSTVAGLRNSMLRALSGAAVTEGEAQRLLAELPTTENPPNIFKQRLAETERKLRQLAQGRRDMMSGTGIDLTKIPALPSASVDAAAFDGMFNALSSQGMNSPEQFDAALNQKRKDGRTLRDDLTMKGLDEAQILRLRSRFTSQVGARSR